MKNWMFEEGFMLGLLAAWDWLCGRWSRVRHPILTRRHTEQIERSGVDEYIGDLLADGWWQIDCCDGNRTRLYKGQNSITINRKAWTPYSHFKENASF